MKLEDIIISLLLQGHKGIGMEYLIKINKEFPGFDFSVLNWKKEENCSNSVKV